MVGLGSPMVLGELNCEAIPGNSCYCSAILVVLVSIEYALCKLTLV